MPDNLRQALDYVEHIPIALGVMASDGTISFKAVSILLVALGIAVGGIMLAINLSISASVAPMSVKLEALWNAYSAGERFTADDGRRHDRRIMAIEQHDKEHDKEAEKWKIQIQSNSTQIDNHLKRHP